LSQHAPSRPPRVAERHDEGTAAQSVRGVLIADDDDTSRRLVRAHLGKLGVPLIREADSGESALAILAAEQSLIDVIICDLKMPTVDGMRLLGMILPCGFLDQIDATGAMPRMTWSVSARALDAQVDTTNVERGLTARIQAFCAARARDHEQQRQGHLSTHLRR
jgi:CheY-like chemotaxis protein